MKSIKETQDFIQANYAPVRDLVIINSPSKEELEKQKVTASGIITSFSDKPDTEALYNQYAYTVLAVGPDVTDVKPGDQILIKVKAVAGMLIEGHEVGIIGRFEVAFVKIKK